MRIHSRNRGEIAHTNLQDPHDQKACNRNLRKYVFNGHDLSFSKQPILESRYAEAVRFEQNLGFLEKALLIMELFLFRLTPAAAIHFSRGDCDSRTEQHLSEQDAFSWSASSMYSRAFLIAKRRGEVTGM